MEKGLMEMVPLGRNLHFYETHGNDMSWVARLAKYRTFQLKVASSIDFVHLALLLSMSMSLSMSFEGFLGRMHLFFVMKLSWV